LKRSPALPPQPSFDFSGFHRLIPSRFSSSGTILSELAESAETLLDIVLLDGATNDRILGEQQGLIGISPHELVYGIPNSAIVNASFTHTSESGARFSDHTRGAWYAADELDTSLAEVLYHKSRRLMEMVVPDLPQERPDKETSTYDDWLADFRCTFHELNPPEQFSDSLKPEPVPDCYRASQHFANFLLAMKSNGIVYPSVRRAGSVCLVCFRPALVYNPRRGKRLEIRLKANESGYEHRVRFVR